MSIIKPQVYNSARTFITKKYNKVIWTDGNVDDIGIRDVQNSTVGHLESRSNKMSQAQLRQWKLNISDVGIGVLGGSADWPVNQYVHDSYRPKLTQRDKVWRLQQHSTNGASILHDSNSSIYFGGTPHWLVPNNGLKVWQVLPQDRVNELNKRRGLYDLDPSISRGRWYKPKGSLTAGGYSGMRYERIRPYGWNVFVNYSTNAAGPCSQDDPYTHEVVEVTDIYKKTNFVSKIKMKDGVVLSTQRTFKSLRRTQTTLDPVLNSMSARHDYLESMQADMQQPNLLLALVAKSDVPMTLELKVELFDSYYHGSQALLYANAPDDLGIITDNIYNNYHQIFAANGNQAPIPTYDSVSGGRQGRSNINSVVIPSSPTYGQSLALGSSWKLYWLMIPFKTFGVQRGINDILYHAGRQLVNIDKIKISLQVRKASRNRTFYVDFIDAVISQELKYSTVARRPITVTSTLFNGVAGSIRRDSRDYAFGMITQGDLIKRNCPPYFFKFDPRQGKKVINYGSDTIDGSISDLNEVSDRKAVYINCFRNSRLMYKVF